MKKLLAIILSITMLLSMGTLSFAGNTSDGTPLAPPSDWAKESVDKAKSLKIINADAYYHYDMSITREEFCELIYNLIGISSNFKNIPTNNPFTDTDNFKIYTLCSLGVINGKTSTEFAPKDLLTREEAATIIVRMVNKVFPMMATQMWFEYDDIKDISDWALSSVQTISNLGFMKGVGNNKFAPKDTYTTEQAIVTVMRVYNASKNNQAKSISFADKLNGNMPKDKNYMFSPLSIKMALMMAANGASGETLKEILSATDVADTESYNSTTRAMIDKYKESDILNLNVANSIWINSDKTSQRFSDAYKELLKASFDATSDIVTDNNATEKINGWVSDKTNKKIPEIISEENKDFLAMLINAVYFKGRWQNEFNKGATQKDIFTSKDGVAGEADFMRRRGWIGYSDYDGVTVVRLPFLTRQDIFNENNEYVETKKLEGVNISMYLLMGEDSFYPEDILNKAEIKQTFMDLSLPKFKVEYSTSLNDILKAIGINKAFEKTAEFEKMFDKGNMWIDSVIHKTYINVDEEGTEAAAVTSVGMAGSALPPEPILVKFNKPFTFVIKDDANGEILFMGEYAFLN